MLNGLVKFFTSLKLTVALLAIGAVLVLLGTLAQEPLGLYAAQERYFKSFFVDGASFLAGWHKLADMILQGFGHPLTPLDAHRLLTAPRIPVFPGGYAVGGLLLINLFAAHLRYYQPGKRKIGIAMIHLGVVLLLVGQFLTDRLSRESSMHIREGESRNYSESSAYELAIVDTTDRDADKVVAIPARRLLRRDEIRHPDLPFAVRVQKFFGNSMLTNNAGAGYEEVKATGAAGPGIWWRELPRETSMQRRDVPSGIVELIGPQGSLGAWFVSGFLVRPQPFTFNGRRYEIALRSERFYKPFSLHLVEFRFDRYPGTDIPRNYSSRVRLQRPDTGEDRELLIYMNNPLRYAGETFYQADFDHEDEKGTILQVVRNPSWLTPYFSCALVAAGLVVQFLTHLLAFAKRRTA